ncbi:MAG: UDP-N-acetylglucosamine 1-carboxyvinyltransferase, partial [Clostridiales bacterium]|nr:UDP-N-acetylglucosamine 1-carboxyvinyltransferase [Clostridiales bacterium]
MEKIVIKGNKPLHGSIEVSGMKNAAVAIVFGTILAEGKCTLGNIPMISDISDAFDILTSVGAVIKRIDKTTYEIDTTRIKPCSAPYDLVKKMRASYYILGAELGRFGRARAAYPGGCDIGLRPIDQHIKGFRALGADVDATNPGGYVNITTEDGKLYGDSVYLDIVSVGATINIMLAACKAEGTTVIDNAAREPHVVDLANFLNSCGADISGAGTEMIKIRGVNKLHGVHYDIIPDMIEAGTYMVAAAATKGELTVTNVIPRHLETVTAKLLEMGAEVEEYDDSVRVRGEGMEIKGTYVKTAPYPGFPTDMNPQMGALMAIAGGQSMIREGVWDNRFKYVDELIRMGADIKSDSKSATFTGVKTLHGAPVSACDLRAGAALIIAGLSANGKTEIDNIYHIQRGYEDIVGKLKNVGADIEL